MVGLGQEVRTQQDRATFGRQVGDEVQYIADCFGIEAGGGLVQHEHLWVVQQGPHQGHALALPGRETPHQLVDPIGHGEALQQFIDLARRHRPIHASDSCRDRQVLAHRESLVQSGVLGDHRRPSTNLVAVGCRVDATYRGASGVRNQDAVEQPRRRGLARAVGAEQGQHLTPTNVDAERIESDVRTEPPGQRVGADHHRTGEPAERRRGHHGPGVERRGVDHEALYRRRRLRDRATLAGLAFTGSKATKRWVVTSWSSSL
jgi:hypothetical protein